MNISDFSHNKKGIAVAWFRILAGMFFVTIAYIFFSYVIYVNIQPEFLPDIQNASAPVNTTEVQSTLDTIEFMWKWFPIILLVGLIIYGVVAAQKREPDEIIY